MKSLKKGFDLRKELLKKHRHGQRKYHAFSFLEDGRDMYLEAADEVVDAINYMLYEEIKNEYDREVLEKMSVRRFNKIYREKLAKRFSGTVRSLEDLIKTLNKRI